MTRTTTKIIALTAATIAVLGGTRHARAEVQVVTTTTDLAAIAHELVGSDGKVTALAPGQQDPHYVDARPSLLLPLSRADLLVVNGLELEVGWLPKLIQGARNPHIQVGQFGYFDASTVIDRLEIPAARIDRAMGDIHPGGNPHFTVDPRAAKKIAVALRDRLVSIDRDNAANYAKRYETFAAALDRVATREHDRFSLLSPERRRIVAYHASLAYLRDWLHLERVATIEPQPGIPPSPGHVAKVLEAMRSTGTTVIVQESYYPKRTSETLAKLAKSKLVVFDGLTRYAEGEHYVDHIEHIAEALYEAMAN